MRFGNIVERNFKAETFAPGEKLARIYIKHQYTRNRGLSPNVKLDFPGNLERVD